MTEISRRGIFALFVGAAAATIVPTQSAALAVIEEIPAACDVESVYYSSFSEMITETLRKHKHVISDNVCMHNPLFRQLKRMERLDRLKMHNEIWR